MLGRSRQPRRCLRLSAVAAIAAFACSSLVFSAAAADIVFSDETFNEPDWDLTLFWLDGLGGTESGYQVLNGGHPGAYRAIEVHLVRDDRYNRVTGFHRYIPQTYSPSQDGAILTVDYAEDGKLLEGIDQGQGGGPALRQDGRIFICSAVWSYPTFSWVQHTVTGQSAADFYDPVDPSNHLDFSATGGEIEFGFWRGNSGYSNDPYTSVAAIDNWRFVLHTQGPTPVTETSWSRLKAHYR